MGGYGRTRNAKFSYDKRIIHIGEPTAGLGKRHVMGVRHIAYARWVERVGWRGGDACAGTCTRIATASSTCTRG